MKLTTAIIRPDCLHQVLEASFASEVGGQTISRTQSLGAEIEKVGTYRGTTAKRERVHKVRLEITVSEAFVEPAVEEPRPARAG